MNLEQIEQFIKTKPVVIFMRGTPDEPRCGFSARSCYYLLESGVTEDKMASFDLDSDDRATWDVLAKRNDWPTSPQIFINGEFIGGHDILKEIRYSLAFIFAYSARKGTPAMRWKDDVPEEVKLERLQRLMALQDAISNEERLQMLGNTYEILVERFNKDGQMLKGRTRCWKKAIFEGDASLIGTLQQVRIHSFNHETLIGERVKPEGQLKVV